MAVLQLNLGSGSEAMGDDVVDACLRILVTGDVGVLELQGAAAEQHPRLREIVLLARALRRRVILRAGTGGGPLREFLSEQDVDLIAGSEPAPGTLAFGPELHVAPDGTTSDLTSVWAVDSGRPQPALVSR